MYQDIATDISLYLHYTTTYIIFFYYHCYSKLSRAMLRNLVWAQKYDSDLHLLVQKSETQIFSEANEVTLLLPSQGPSYVTVLYFYKSLKQCVEISRVSSYFPFNFKSYTTKLFAFYPLQRQKETEINKWQVQVLGIIKIVNIS